MSTKSLILLSALSLLTAGCGKKAEYKTTAGGVTVEQKGDVASVQVKDKSGAVMKAEASEKGVSLPPDFPKDVPLFKDALVIAAVVVDDTFQVQTTFKAPVAEALKFYAEKLKSEGWDVQIAREQGETGIISAEKGNRECRVRLSKGDQLTVAMIMTSAAGK
jgi:hypothetical protein